VKQELVRLSGSNNNSCVSATWIGPESDQSPFMDPTESSVALTLQTDAFPNPHEGDPIKLTNTKAIIAIDATTIQAGVDAGIISDGMQVPSTLKLVVAGSNTVEGTHTFVVSSTAVIHVVAGQAQPLKVTVALPNTVWHPKSSEAPVTFSEKSMKITSTLHILVPAGITATFTCQPSPALSVGSLVAQPGDTVPTTTTPTTGPGSTDVTQGSTVAPTDPGTGSTSSGSGSLPRTGASWVLLLVLAAAAIDVGIVMMGATRRRLRHR